MKKVRCFTNTGRYKLISKKQLFFRPCVYGIIRNSGKVLLLTNRSNNKFWLPGGGAEIGESISYSLYREVYEETGLRVRNCKFVSMLERFFYYEPTKEAFQALLLFYYCKVYSNKITKNKNVQDDESKKPRWIKIKNLRTSDFADHGSYLLQLIRK